MISVRERFLLALGVGRAAGPSICLPRSGLGASASHWPHGASVSASPQACLGFRGGSAPSPSRGSAVREQPRAWPGCGDQGALKPDPGSVVGGPGPPLPASPPPVLSAALVLYVSVSLTLLLRPALGPSWPPARGCLRALAKWLSPIPCPPPAHIRVHGPLCPEVLPSLLWPLPSSSCHHHLPGSALVSCSLAPTLLSMCCFPWRLTQAPMAPGPCSPSACR